MKKVVCLLIFTVCTLHLYSQAVAMGEDSTDYGRFYTDTTVNVCVHIMEPFEGEREIIFVDHELDPNKGGSLDTTYYMVHVNTDPELYLLTQMKVPYCGALIPSYTPFITKEEYTVQKIVITEAYRKARHRALHVYIDVQKL